MRAHTIAIRALQDAVTNDWLKARQAEIKVKLHEAKVALDLAENAYLALRALGVEMQEATDMTDLNACWDRHAKLRAIVEKQSKAL